MTKGTNKDIHSDYSETNYFVFDFNRIYKDTGLKTESLNGLSGTENSNGVYEIQKENNLYGRKTELEDLNRIYMSTNLAYVSEAKIKEITLKINNKEAAMQVTKSQPKQNFNTFFISFMSNKEKIYLETDKVYTFKLTYYLDDNTYYEFEKSIKIIDVD